MTTVIAPVEHILMPGDLLNHLGGISPNRVRLTPLPGHVNEGDVIDGGARKNCLFELFDGTSVEKATR